MNEIRLPKELFKSFVEVCQKWEQFSDELEDFLLMSNKDSIQELRQAKLEYSQGKVKSLQSFK